MNVEEVEVDVMSVPIIAAGSLPEGAFLPIPLRESSNCRATSQWAYNLDVHTTIPHAIHDEGFEFGIQCVVHLIGGARYFFGGS
eukprot:1403861-Amphidinium_carterae.2